MAAPTNTITTAQVAKGLDLEMIRNFDQQTDRLMELLGISTPEVMQANTAMFQYKITGALNTTTVGEGEEVPLSQYSVDKVPIGTFTPTPYRKATTAQAILKNGYTNAVAKTDEKMVKQVRGERITDFITYMANGTGTATGTTLQAALIYAETALQNAMEANGDEAEDIVHFVNRNDIAEYLATAKIETQMLYGMEYVQNFLGVRNLFVTNKVPAGTIYVTPTDNIHIYGTDFSELAMAGLDYETSANGLIGVAHDATKKNVSCETHVLTGMMMLAEILDYIIVATIKNASGDYPDDTPDSTWTVAQLTAYAADKSIDLGSATTKADILAAIEAAS